MIENLELQEKFNELIKSRNTAGIRDLFENYNIVDLAEMTGELDIREALYLLKILDKQTVSELFTYLEPDKQESLVETLTSAEIKNLISEVYTDDIADFLHEMPSHITKKVLAAVPADLRQEINELLSYKENSCGSIMSTDYLELDLDDTVLQAMETIRRQRDMAESISYGYVTSNDKLIGAIALRTILLSPNDAKLEDIMSTHPIRVHTGDDQEVAIEQMRNYDITMIPVVDEEEDLVGVITADDVVDAIEEEATEDIHKMNAVVNLNDGYLESNPVRVALSCLPWLIVLMVYDSISEGVINSNDALVAAFPILSVFIPMLMGTAGNAGSQSSTMVIRGITVDKMGIKDFWKVFWKEFRVSLIVGSVLFAANMLRVMLVVKGGTLPVAFISSATLFLVVILGELIGGTLPLIATALHMDPAVMASPLVTSICDMISLFVYFGLAGKLL